MSRLDERCPRRNKGVVVAVREMAWNRGPYDDLPDVRDGLTRVERIILYVLWETQKERGDRNVPTAMLYGRVVERVNISVSEFQRIMQKLVGVQGGSTHKRPNPFDGSNQD